MVISSKKQCERTAVFIFTSIIHCFEEPLRWEQEEQTGHVRVSIDNSK
jgi:hypothetical protein